MLLLRHLSKEYGLFLICLLRGSDYREGDHTLSQDELYRNTAEFLYHWHSGSASKTLISTIDNTQFATYKGTKPGDPVPAFFTMGYSCPGVSKKKYLERIPAKHVSCTSYSNLGSREKGGMPSSKTITVKRERAKKRVFSR